MTARIIIAQVDGSGTGDDSFPIASGPPGMALIVNVALASMHKVLTSMELVVI